MMVMTLPWHYLGLQGQWRRVAAFDYSDPMIATWGPWVIVSLIGGIILPSARCCSSEPRHAAPRASPRRPCRGRLCARRCTRPGGVPRVAERLRDVEHSRRAADGSPPTAIRSRNSSSIRRPRRWCTGRDGEARAHAADEKPADRPRAPRPAVATLGEPRRRRGACRRRPARPSSSFPPSSGRMPGSIYGPPSAARLGSSQARPAYRQPPSTTPRRRRSARSPGTRRSSTSWLARQRSRRPDRGARPAPPATARRASPQTPNFPSLAGQSAFAIYKQLHDYRTGARVHPQMTPVGEAAAGRRPRQCRGLLRPPRRGHMRRSARASCRRTTAIVRLANEGDSRRRIPACN